MKKIFYLMLLLLPLRGITMNQEISGIAMSRHIASVIDSLLTGTEHINEQENKFLFYDYEHTQNYYTCSLADARALIEKIEELVFVGPSDEQEGLLQQAFTRFDESPDTLTDDDLACLQIARFGEYILRDNYVPHKRLKDLLKDQKQKMKRSPA